jgi:L-2-hydroxyglutarate oxidase LhgO
VPHRKCDKLIVATQAAELAGLESVHAQGRANGSKGSN